MQVTHSTTTSLRSVRLSQSDKSSSVYSPRTPAILLASSIERKPLILGPTQSWSESAIIIAGSSVLLHRSEVVAAEHLAKHVLSDAARKACLRAFPALRNLEVMTNPVLAGRVAAQGSSHPAFAQALEVYREIISSTVRDAVCLGWVVTTKNATDIAMGTSGFVVVIVDNMVRTAFLPGLVVDPLETFDAQQRSPREQRDHADRVAQWSDDQKYFHDIFKSALKRIRNFTSSSDRVGEYAALREFIPRTSEMNAAIWSELREQAGHEPI